MLKVRCLKICRQFLPRTFLSIPQNHMFTSFPLNFISKMEFLIWLESKGLNVFHSVRKNEYFGIYKFWREIIPYCKNRDRTIFNRIVHVDNSFENGLLYHFNVEGDYKMMNHIMSKMLSKVEPKKTPEHFSEIIIHSDEKNMKLFKNCWDERTMINKSIPDIMNGDIIYIDELILHVGISVETLIKRIFDIDHYEDVYENLTFRRILSSGIKIKDHLEKNYNVKIELK